MEEIQTIIPHSEFGTPNCHGWLAGRDLGHVGEVFCTKCAAILFVILPPGLRRVLDRIEASLDVATALCRYCGSVNLFPGRTRVAAFICQECGKENASRQ